MHTLAASSAGDTVTGWVIIIVAILAYWTPTAVAVIRQVPNTGSVIVINVLLGWTFIGWIVALAMACRSKRPQQIVVPYAPYPLPPMPFPQQPPPQPAPENGQ